MGESVKRLLGLEMKMQMHLQLTADRCSFFEYICDSSEGTNSNLFLTFSQVLTTAMRGDRWLFRPKKLGILIHCAIVGILLNQVLSDDILHCFLYSFPGWNISLTWISMSSLFFKQLICFQRGSMCWNSWKVSEHAHQDGLCCGG